MLKYRIIDALQSAAEKAGFRVNRLCRYIGVPDVDHETLRMVRPYTMTSRERIYSLMESTRYVTQFKIPGSMVECGVWRGGSSMAILRTLVATGSTDRDVYLYDTFEGMAKPSDKDGDAERQAYEKQVRPDGSSDWCRSELDEVRANLSLCKYPDSRIHLVKGKVEETIPAHIPETIALLRLDTDWYESTRHELIHLYPRLVRGGVLILDDYGTWEGSYRAAREYFEAMGTPFYLHRVDDASRLLIKP